MILGKMIAAYREKHKISVRKMADLMGVEFTGLFKFEKGRPGNVRAWVRIVKFCLTEEE